MSKRVDKLLHEAFSLHRVGLIVCYMLALLRILDSSSFTIALIEPDDKSHDHVEANVEKK